MKRISIRNVPVHSWILLFSACLVFPSCGKEKDCCDLSPAVPEVLAFGHFYGECLGERCIETYVLGESGLAEDIVDDYFQTYPAPNELVLLPDSLFQKVKGLRQSFPPELLGIPDGTIGMPDAGDWGGFYIAWKKDQVLHQWYIDTQKGSVPASLHAFLDEVELAIGMLP